MKNSRFEFLLFTFYFLLSLVITYPLIFNFNSTIYGSPERTADSFGTIYYRFFLQQKVISSPPYMIVVG